MKKLHDKAMLILKSIAPNASEQEIVSANAKALKCERAAALMIPKVFENEPTRSVLFRSAAWMAFNSNQFEEAMSLAKEGLAGAIHSEIISELKEIFKNGQANLISSKT